MILVLSGTKDGREIVYGLLDKGYDLIVTTATGYGKSLYEEKNGLRVVSERLDYDGMIKLINDNSVKLAIDATHPYADKVSDNIHKACNDLKIEYIRYQRQESILDNYADIIEWAVDYNEAAEKLIEASGNVLLTTGSKTLEVFSSKLSVERLYARLLPTSSILKKCEDIGLEPSNIIAMQGPFSKEMNIEIIKKYNIDILVTKDSGKVGGTIEKFEAAKEMGIPVIVISRPELNESTVLNNIDELTLKVSELYG
ncbi:precorrin-6A reductase [Wukongibacter baidiensis]|uniref:precorrin-6A reductase n=1 Tax=Wukongibacter baidiensis TaxID=1723361 RepID=UPI003D7F294A